MSTGAELMRKWMDTVAGEDNGLPVIDHIIISYDGETYKRLDEGRFIDGRFKKNIRIDRPTHMAGDGDVHAHVFGRRGNQLVVVKFNGTASHGTKGILHPKDADALRAEKFCIRDDRIVEWVVWEHDGPELLLG